jgi:hypothetical protein
MLYFSLEVIELLLIFGLGTLLLLYPTPNLFLSLSQSLSHLLQLRPQLLYLGLVISLLLLVILAIITTGDHQLLRVLDLGFREAHLLRHRFVASGNREVVRLGV